ncbi:hypothetical protein BHE74_00055682 [Ensete ventricosum]|nr:hypothetical protein GW17_00015718 [Ensete ventricosum]RWW39029.1 hypothetical protein BHE74_00055682 [Ensete ventricosum]
MDGSRASLAALFDLAPLLLLSTTLVAVTVASATTDSLDGQSIFGPSKYSCQSRPNYSVSYPVQSVTDHFLWIINLTHFVFVRNIANNQFNGWIPQEFKSITNLE